MPPQGDHIRGAGEVEADATGIANAELLEHEKAKLAQRENATFGYLEDGLNQRQSVVGLDKTVEGSLVGKWFFSKPSEPITTVEPEEAPKIAAKKPADEAAEKEKRRKGKEYLYVAIGSEMNPISIEGRGVKPIESWPVRVVGFERRFPRGMADIMQKEGAEFHAVLHRMTEEDMLKLDTTEAGNSRIDVDCYRYDDTHVVGTAYQMVKSDLAFDAAGSPSERYIDILTMGMEHFGCDPAAIAELKATPNQKKRKKPEEYLKLEIPPESINCTFTWDDVVASDGQDGRPVRSVFNGKVLEFTEPDGVSPEIIAERRQQALAYAGKDRTHVVTKMVYDPQFPPRESVDDMTDAEIGRAEDTFVEGNSHPPKFFKRVGTVSDYRPRRDRAYREALAEDKTKTQTPPPAAVAEVAYLPGGSCGSQFKRTLALAVPGTMMGQP